MVYYPPTSGGQRVFELLRITGLMQRTREHLSFKALHLHEAKYKVPDIKDLELRLTVNNELRQSGTYHDMIFTGKELTSYIYPKDLLYYPAT